MQVYDDPAHRILRNVEPAGNAVRLDVANDGNVLAGLTECQHPSLGPGRRDVEAGLEHRRLQRRRLDGQPGLRIQDHQRDMSASIATATAAATRKSMRWSCTSTVYLSRTLACRSMLSSRWPDVST